MGGIEWTDRTVNPLSSYADGKRGWHCVKVSSGCANCYAETLNRRFGTGRAFQERGNEDVQTYLNDEALKKASRFRPTKIEDGKRRSLRVFYGSATDLFGHWVSSEVVQELLDHVVEQAARGITPQILTKRPKRLVREIQIWARRHCQQFPSSVQLGFSAEDQEAFDQRWADISLLAERCAWGGRLFEGVVFCSYEPALGPLTIREAVYQEEFEIPTMPGLDTMAKGSVISGCEYLGNGRFRPVLRLGWLLVGGESGAKARPFNIDWAADVFDECDEAGIPFFMKQLGRHPFLNSEKTPNEEGCKEIQWNLKDKKGGDMSEWPEDLRVREFPEVSK